MVPAVPGVVYAINNGKVTAGIGDFARIRSIVFKISLISNDKYVIEPEPSDYELDDKHEQHYQKFKQFYSDFHNQNYKRQVKDPEVECIERKTFFNMEEKPTLCE